MRRNAAIIKTLPRNGGATCTYANRIFVQCGIADKFIAEMTKSMSNYVMGRGTEATTTLGAYVSVTRDLVN
jgi:succinate-semialdehyde dehydrogenase/glutarate-semialdehyde dehydrogenase